jgi:hypothetical protein
LKPQWLVWTGTAVAQRHNPPTVSSNSELDPLEFHPNNPPMIHLPHLPPGTSGATAALAIGLTVWGVTLKTVNDLSYTFEPRNPPRSFEPRLAGYMRATETLIGLATGSIVLLAGSSVLRSGGGRLPWLFASPMVMMGFSVIYALFFMGILNFFYEGFLHHRDSYTAAKYRLITTLGFSALFTFAVGYIWLAFVVANG